MMYVIHFNNDTSNTWLTAPWSSRTISITRQWSRKYKDHSLLILLLQSSTWVDTADQIMAKSNLAWKIGQHYTQPTLNSVSYDLISQWLKGNFLIKYLMITSQKEKERAEITSLPVQPACQIPVGTSYTSCPTGSLTSWTMEELLCSILSNCKHATEHQLAVVKNQKLSICQMLMSPNGNLLERGIWKCNIYQKIILHFAKICINYLNLKFIFELFSYQFFTCHCLEENIAAKLAIHLIICINLGGVDYVHGSLNVGE